ncbi:MAG: VOC family protein [Chloroflexota bacterium]|nr:VOC family protein [Chloroflexota bacterium]
MAYRFLLEVPVELEADANVAVAAAGDTQVILARPSHGRGFDNPSLDLTIAAHSLRVIDTLYDWFDMLGASRPNIRLVLHSGERIVFEATDRGAAIAAIRHDQPWVERSIPKIGEHEEETFTADFTYNPAQESITAERASIDATGANAPNVAAAESREGGSTAVAVRDQRHIQIRALNHVAIWVSDLANAERFYAEFFQMELAGRARQSENGYETVNGDYRWEEASAAGTEADIAFLSQPALTLALHRAGRGARLDRYAVIDHLSIDVDATTFMTLKGEAMLRTFEILASAETAFTFRDPFGVTWEVTVGGRVGGRR